MMIQRVNIKKIIFVVLLFSGITYMFSCANIVAPTGGPKDTEPPKVLRSEPPNFTPNFYSSSVRIYFDEYVELKGLQQKLIVSPPLKTNPEFKLRRKSLIMELNPEELSPNTTYNIFLDDAIVDLTEGNPIINFRYVFSTGDYLDSLSVKGNVVDAYTLKPEEGVYVMLYDTIYDSVPYLQKPKYIAKANDKGDFEISFIMDGQYLLFALQDINSTYTFDQPDEKIAFSDSLITPEYIELPQLLPDSLQNEAEQPQIIITEEGDTIFVIENDQDEVVLLQDTVEVVSEDEILDSLSIDSLEKASIDYYFYNLRLFQEKDTIQKISSAATTRKNVVLIAFRIETDSVSFRDLKNPLDEDNYYFEMNEGRDSLTMWLVDFEQDSLFLEIKDGNEIIDTVNFSTEHRDRGGRGRASQAETADAISFKNNLGAGGNLPYFKELVITANNPIKSFENNCFVLTKSDTVNVETEFEISGITNRKLNLKTKLDTNSTYSLIIPDSCVFDIYDNSHDSLRVAFRTDSEEDYGKIFLNLNLPQNNQQYILQLINEKEEVIKDSIINTSGIYEFINLKPDTYNFRLIEDKNKDGKWTAGNYLKGLQAEKVFYFKEKLPLRAFWEMESEWEVQPEID